nr:CBM_HP1_G0018150.mRNA.1.CDS.1 [Saccharomyces cerevisiae]
MVPRISASPVFQEDISSMGICTTLPYRKSVSHTLRRDFWSPCRSMVKCLLLRPGITCATQHKTENLQYRGKKVVRGKQLIGMGEPDESKVIQDLSARKQAHREA